MPIKTSFKEAFILINYNRIIEGLLQKQRIYMKNFRIFGFLARMPNKSLQSKGIVCRWKKFSEHTLKQSKLRRHKCIGGGVEQ